MALREGLLVLLADGQRHGYELKTEFEQRTGHVWRINTGQVYTTLERLQRDGLVEPAGTPGPDAPTGKAGERRRPYELTERGLEEAREWLGGEALDGDQLPRDELTMKVLLASQSGIEDAHRVIDVQRHRLLAQLQQLRHSQPDGADLASQLCHDARAVRIEADLRWLDLCTDRLTAAARATGNRRARNR